MNYKLTITDDDSNKVAEINALSADSLTDKLYSIERHQPQLKELQRELLTELPF